jgi:hypothetical protein
MGALFSFQKPTSGEAQGVDGEGGISIVNLHAL